MIDYTQIENLNAMCSDWRVSYSVYPYSVHTINELIMIFLDKLNECVDVVNEYTKILEDFVNWIENEGIKDEVAKQLQELIDSGYFEDVINEEIFGDMWTRIEELEKYSHIATYDLGYEGCVGDGVTDNKALIEAVFMDKLQSGESVFIPTGTYKIILTDADLKESDMTSKAIYPWLRIIDKTDVTIFGDGKLLFDCSALTKKPGAFYFKNCDGLTIKGIKIQGDTVFGASELIGDVGNLNGLLLANCNGCLIDGIEMSDMLATVSISGDMQSPATSGIISHDNIVTNCIFKNYGQNTTFGSGTSNFIFTNNLCINALQAGIKVSTEAEGLLMYNTSQNILIDNNIITWTSDYEFGIPDWSPTHRYVPTGIMLQCHSQNVKVSNNIIDESRILQDVSANKISEIACITCFRGNTDIELVNKNVTIEGNKLYKYFSNPAISCAPNLKNLYIKNNEILGNISMRTFTASDGYYETLLIEGNNFTGDAYILFKNAKYNQVIIKGNTGYTGTNVIQFEEITANELHIVDNVMTDLQITKTVALDTIITNISNNRKVLLINLSSSENATHFTITNNFFKSNGSICVLNMASADTRVTFAGNEGQCGGNYFTINQGKLTIDATLLESNNATKVSLGTCFIMAGNFYGVGSPATYSGNQGITYTDYGTTNDAYWIKVGSDGAPNKGWKQITLV